MSSHILIRSAVMLASFVLTATAATVAKAAQPVLADSKLLIEAGITVLAEESMTGVGFAHITPLQAEKLSRLAHEHGKCGGFEALPVPLGLDQNVPLVTDMLAQLRSQELKNRRFRPNSLSYRQLQHQATIATAVSEVSEENIKKGVELLAGFPSRVHNATNPNAHVVTVKANLETMLKASGVKFEIDEITHTSTRQNSLRVRIPGKTRPTEIVVLGGHMDSINHDWFAEKKAPGADDNASGSADLFEALRVFVSKGPADRTVEFFWYAGEEGGLLGSAEIARDYKKQNKDVVAVLQLDMTMFPGDGEFVLGSMTDFTSAWLRGYLEQINALYTQAKIIDDKCGYGCSDHASWHRQGYPAVMPFEASFNGMNHNIHTAKDVVDGKSSFRHSAMFSKIALALAMDLGNSTAREP